MGWFGRKPKTPQLPRAELLRAKPMRNRRCTWEESGKDGITVHVSWSRAGLHRWVAWLFCLPKEHEVVLDSIGAAVWHLCDGETNLEGIVKVLCEQYSLERREAEASLMRYLGQLAKRGLLAVAAPGREQGKKRAKEGASGVR